MFNRITRSQAKKLFLGGEDIYLLSSNCRPDNDLFRPVKINYLTWTAFTTHNYDTDYDNLFPVILHDYAYYHGLLDLPDVHICFYTKG